MERRFDMSDFEQSLKDHADQFKMTPSKRVWNGIYNNLHPGSKWPSITVAVVFLITLVSIGSLNNSAKHFNGFPHSNLKPSIATSKSDIEPQGGKAFGSPINSSNNSSNTDLKTNRNTTTKNKIHSEDKNASDKISSSSVSIVVNNASGKSTFVSKIQNTIPSNTVALQRKEATLPDLNVSVVNAVNQQKIKVSLLPKSVMDYADLQRAFAQQQEKLTRDLFIAVSYKTFSILSSESLAGKLINPDKIEPIFPDEYILNQNVAISVNKTHRKKNNKIEWTFYVNPVISTVSFNKKTIQPSNNTSSIVVLSNQPSFKIIHNPRFGVETGAEMSYQIAKKFQLITGLNLSYSGFNNVSNLVHPTFATLNLNDNQTGTYSKTYITHYGNGQSQDHINLVNYSIQASIPLGIQYNIWKSSKIKVDVSSLLEPSVVLKDDAYLISSDGRYYVNDPMLVRRTNVDGHFGSYITFIGKKIKWHLGPDFRYQLFSTYKNLYPTKEHFIDYGIRIGISK